MLIIFLFKHLGERKQTQVVVWFSIQDLERISFQTCNVKHKHLIIYWLNSLWGWLQSCNFYQEEENLSTFHNYSENEPFSSTNQHDKKRKGMRFF